MTLIRISFWIVSLLLPLLCQAQPDSISFHVAYQPNKTYQLESRSFMELHYVFDSTSGEDSTVSSRDLPPSMDMQIDQLNRSIIQTDVPDSVGTFPFSISIDTIGIHMLQDGDPIVLPTNIPHIQGSEGRMMADGSIYVDSLIGENMQPDMKTIHESIMRSTSSQVAFPAYPLAVGDTFYQVVPITIPVAGTAIQMNSELTYVLTQIQRETAFFNITQDFTMDGDMDQFQMEVKGQGTGTCVYHLTHRFLTSFYIDLTANMNIQVEGQQIETSLKGITRQTVDIQDNP